MNDMSLHPYPKGAPTGCQISILGPEPKFHLTQTQLVAGDIRQSAGRVPGAFIPDSQLGQRRVGVKLALLPSSGYGSNSNSAHSTSSNVDLVEWHMNCMLQFLREHQPNAVEAAPDLEVVQNPLAKSQGVPDQQAMDALMLEVVVALPCRRSPRLALPMCGRCVLGRRSDALSGKCSCAPNGPPLLACVRSFLVWVAGWNTSTPRTWPPRCSSTTRSSSPLQEGSKDVRSWWPAMQLSNGFCWNRWVLSRRWRAATFNCLCCLLPPSLTLPHVLLTMACLLGPLQRSFVACAIGRASCLSSGCGSPVPLLPLLLRRPPLTTLASSPLAALSKPMATMRSCAPPLVQIPFVWLIARSGLPNRST